MIYIVYNDYNVYIQSSGHKAFASAGGLSSLSMPTSWSSCTLNFVPFEPEWLGLDRCDQHFPVEFSFKQTHMLWASISSILSFLSMNLFYPGYGKLQFVCDAENIINIENTDILPIFPGVNLFWVSIDLYNPLGPHGWQAFESGRCAVGWALWFWPSKNSNSGLTTTSATLFKIFKLLNYFNRFHSDLM